MTHAPTEAKLFLSLVDLTSLNETDTEDTIRDLCSKATTEPRTAAVCVYPRWVALAKKLVQGTDVTVATVVNFPTGQLSPAECSAVIDQCRRDGCDEIDFVIDWNKYKETGSKDELSNYIREMVRLCKPCKTKVICETSQLTPTQIRQVADIAIESGVNFLKTSTGKVSGGATVEAVTIFAQAIKASGQRVGIKPSGGIKTFEDCRALWRAVTDILGGTSSGYDTKELFRFGASGVRSKLLETINDKQKSDDAEAATEGGETTAADY